MLSRCKILFDSHEVRNLEIFVHLESDRVPLVAIKAWFPDESKIEEVKLARTCGELCAFVLRLSAARGRSSSQKIWVKIGKVL